MRKQAKNKMVLVELKVRNIVSLLLALRCDHNKVYEDFPLLRNFAGGWPIHALIQQYLKNTTEQAWKAALRQASWAAAISNVPARASHHVQASASAVQIKTPSFRNSSSKSTQRISTVKSNSSKKKSTPPPDATAVEPPAKVILILFLGLYNLTRLPGKTFED
jgi:hypothetical protein